MLLSNEIDESVYGLRKKLHQCILDGMLGESVIQLLLPKGEPLLYEKPLWDYKIKLPNAPLSVKPNQELLKEYSASMAEIVKDAVSFYNSYGGYILVGVQDKPRKIIGYNEHFDVDELNKKIKGATGHDVDCHYGIYKENLGSNIFNLGLLFIPQRPDSEKPAQFRKDAPEHPVSGKKAYLKDDYFLRQGDECRPSKTPDDICFLATQNRRSFKEAREICLTRMIDNNLGPSDPDLIRFIGREDDLKGLWEWLLEKFSPLKLLAGFGGVGKSTIARKFAESVATDPPYGLERVIWLSAKQKYWRSFGGHTECANISDVKYSDCRSLLYSLLLELGYLEQELDDEADYDELFELCLNSLKLFPSLVIIDDVDSLEQTEQQAVFSNVNTLFSQTIGHGLTSSKSILTARLDLSAAPSQLRRIRGLEYNDFTEYLETVANELKIDKSFLCNKKLLEKFHKATDGSPIFANSVLRLVACGEKIETAIEEWRDTDGEEVRKFAFEREIGFLSDSELRTLLALVVLGRTSMVELEHILEIKRSKLRDNLEALRKYHLIVREGDIPAGGPDIAIPNSIRLMQSVLETHVRDFQNIKKRCIKARAGLDKRESEISPLISRVVNLWKSGDYAQALEVAEWAHKNNPKHPDLCCLLGSAYMKLEGDKDNARKADSVFRKAMQANCKRIELYTQWLEAKSILEDWQGIIELTKQADTLKFEMNSVYHRAISFKMLGEDARARGELSNTSDYFIKGAEEIKLAFDKRVIKYNIKELNDLKIALVREYISIQEQLNSDPNEYLYTWLACCKAIDLQVSPASLIQHGLTRLKEWWSAVEVRDKYDHKAPAQLKIQLKTINRILNELSHQKRHNEDVYNELIDTRDYLQDRMDRY